MENDYDEGDNDENDYDGNDNDEDDNDNGDGGYKYDSKEVKSKRLFSLPV